MASGMRFDEVLDAVERLSPDDQESLVDILERRRIARRRSELAQDIQEARQEFQAGQIQARTSAEIMNEIGA